MTPLWRPSTKQEHDESLKRFMKRFNEAHPSDIAMQIWAEEQFVYDGVINLWGVLVHFDWEKRHDWRGSKFIYDTLGQFERKFDHEKHIELTIQSNMDDTHFVVAWHSDFNEVVDVFRNTNYQYEEEGKMRTTHKFQTFNYQEMAQFKTWLLRTYRR